MRPRESVRILPNFCVSLIWIPGGGVSTTSITCTTPFAASISARITFESLINTPSGVMEMLMSFPSRVLAFIPFERSVDITLPPTAWYRRICVRSPEGSWRRVSTVPVGSAAKAASVGANTVKGPSPESASASPAAITAASSVLCTSLLTTMSTTVAGLGSRTASITCTMPLSVTMSATLTIAPLMKIPFPLMVTVTFCP